LAKKLFGKDSFENHTKEFILRAQKRFGAIQQQKTPNVIPNIAFRSLPALTSQPVYAGELSSLRTNLFSSRQQRIRSLRRLTRSSQDQVPQQTLSEILSKVGGTSSVIENKNVASVRRKDIPIHGHKRIL
jgi:hypothetical protein